MTRRRLERCQHGRKAPARCQQLRWRAGLHNTPSLQHHDLVTGVQPGGLVGDLSMHKMHPVSDQLAPCLYIPCLRVHVTAVHHTVQRAPGRACGGGASGHLCRR